MSANIPDDDTDRVFLLPYLEEPRYTLDHPREATQSSGSDCEQPFEDDSKEIYDACRIERNDDAPLENGVPDDVVPMRFLLRTGQFLLLRPSENSLRPSLGKAVYFWRAKQIQNKTPSYARIKWFYRAEDLSERPTEAVGEDEVFETEHFDNIDVGAIAGRCKVCSYGEWVSLKITEREALDGKASDMKKESPSMASNRETDELSDTESSHGDNYSSAAVHYYCRRFYDPIKQVFATSKFEDENADPAEWCKTNGMADGEFDPGVALHSSDDDISDGDIWSEDDVASDRTAKRKRRKPKAKVAHRTRKADGKRERMSQFALPSDTGVPETLPCRDAEKEKVKRFLEDAIKESADGVHGGSRCLYISGVPGTGKTATVREVVRTLNRRRALGEIPPFEAIEVNAMSLPDPNLVYSELYRAITGSQGFAPMHAAQLLEKRFSGELNAPVKKARNRGVGGPTAREKGKCVILILDEMDVLVSRKQKVLYDVLEWPTKKNARMAVIGIANTMDLPERMLPRLGSRLGLNRLTYPPYSSEKLTIILNMKVSEKNDIKFAPSAIKLCAQKIGAVSGDIRRAMEIIRRASEIVTDEHGRRKGIPTVAAKHINMAFNDIAGGSRLVALQQLSLFEKLFLACAINLARSEGSFAMDVTSTISAISAKALDDAMRHSKLFEDSGLPSYHELENACWSLIGQRYVILEKAPVFADSRIIVNVSADDCSFALSSCPLVLAILNSQSTEQGLGR